jgi:hypothetical protein
MPVISALWRLRQEDHESPASLGYVARPVSENKKQHGDPYLTTQEAKTGGLQFEISWDNKCVRIYLNPQMGVREHTCRPSNTGGSDEEDYDSRPARQKNKVHKTPCQQKNLGVVACSCHSSYSEKQKIGELWSRPAQAQSKTLS